MGQPIKVDTRNAPMNDRVKASIGGAMALNGKEEIEDKECDDKSQMETPVCQNCPKMTRASFHLFLNVNL